MTYTCRFCSRPLSHAGDGLWLADGELCTPAGRTDSTCQYGYYPAMFGIDPLKLLDHDFACACQRTITHAAQWDSGGTS